MVAEWFHHQCLSLEGFTWYIIQCGLASVRTCEGLPLVYNTLVTFIFIQALPELIIFGFSMCGFGPCGFMCVVAAIGHNKVTAQVSWRSSTPYSGACNHQVKAPKSYGLMVVLVTSFWH